jgi:hypothetical protein
VNDYLQMLQVRLDRQEHDRAARAHYLLERQEGRASPLTRLADALRGLRAAPPTPVNTPPTPACAEN